MRDACNINDTHVTGSGVKHETVLVVTVVKNGKKACKSKKACTSAPYCI